MYKVETPGLEEYGSLNVYLSKLEVWEAITQVEKEKRSAMVAQSFANNSVNFKKELQDKL